MKIRDLILFISMFGLGGALGAMTGGGLMRTIIARFLCMLIVAPALIFLSLVGIEQWRHRDQPKVMDGLTLGCATLVLVILGFTSGGAAIFHYRDAEVRRFVDEVLPLLDDYRKKTGTYPRSLGEVTDRKMPTYFKVLGYYTTDGASFTFYYENPDSIMGGHILTHSHRTWSIAD